MSIGALTQCCFCGLAIASRPGEPLVLRLEVEEQGEQHLYSHIACLKTRVHDSVPLLLPGDEEGDEERWMRPNR